MSEHTKMHVWATPVRPSSGGFGEWDAEGFNTYEPTDEDGQYFESIEQYIEWLDLDGRSQRYEIIDASDLDGRIHDQNGRRVIGTLFAEVPGGPASYELVELSR